MSRILIISPSGKLYGSESVLIDYLTNSRLSPHVYVPANSDLQKKLHEAKGQYKVKTYNTARLPVFYTKLFLLLLLRRYKSVYINEAGHVKYVLLFAKYLPRIHFTVHVRMIEDTAEYRWKMINGHLPANLSVISISNYISRLLPFSNHMISDPFIFSDKSNDIQYGQRQSFNIGIIGRVTLTKGIGLLILILDEINNRNSGDIFKFHLFGEISDDMPPAVMSALQKSDKVVLHGYVKGAENIYNNLHAVMHLSRVEALGRIFFESVNYGLPFVGIKAAGIGEIADAYNYNELIVHPGTDKEIADNLLNALTMLVNKYEAYKACIEKLKGKMAANMSVRSYSSTIDNILSDF